MYPPIFKTEKVLPKVTVLPTDSAPDNWTPVIGFLYINDICVPFLNKYYHVFVSPLKYNDVPNGTTAGKIKFQRTL